jgi:2'-5' RNA ligase
MVQSVELLVDDAVDEWIWAQWRALEAAGLPSQVRHGSLTNWPHVTLAVADAIPAAIDAGLSPIVKAALPMPMRVGGVMWFPGRRHVVARAIIVSAALLRLHAEIADRLDGLEGRGARMAPGAWTPHITLARGVRTEQLGDMIAALAGVDGIAEEHEGIFTACRRWDSDAKATWQL